MTKTSYSKYIWALAILAALAVIAVLAYRSRNTATGSSAKATTPAEPALTVQEEVAARMADPVYSAQLDELAEAQRQIQLRRAELCARLEEYTRGKAPAEYESEAEFQSLKRRLDDIDRAFADERRRAIETIHNRISK